MLTTSCFRYWTPVKEECKDGLAQVLACRSSLSKRRGRLRLSIQRIPCSSITDKLKIVGAVSRKCVVRARRGNEFSRSSPCFAPVKIEPRDNK